MTDPSHYAVSYRINPWMRPEAWDAGGAGLSRRAAAASQSLARILSGLGAAIHWVGAAEGLPDLVFPANAAVVLDGRVLLARFRCPERRGEEPVFRRAFERLAAQGIIADIATLPDGCFQEGAGDAVWDAGRRLFWTGWGPRSDRVASDHVAATFGRPVVPLELATERFYHLDTCFCPLAGGEILYYPPAFSADALAAIRERVNPGDLIEADEHEAAAFCVNAISLRRELVMASAPASLRAKLAARGYRLRETELAPFILSGGAAFCMTLRLDHASVPKETAYDRQPDARALA